ncbi:MAG: hypothetical protein WBO77_00055 [Microgenomates group bacterium]
MTNPEGHSQQDLQKTFDSFPNTGTADMLCDTIKSMSTDALPIQGGERRPLDIWWAGRKIKEGEITIGMVVGFHPDERYIVVQDTSRLTEGSSGQEIEFVRFSPQETIRWTDVIRV